ncbi:MAG TPA: hypothetical protein VLU41_01710 [Ideonella sp.]|nr:hypothetical protein [Ideonella sp.]
MEEKTTIEVARRGLRWGPIWGGLFVVAAIQIVMQLFGMAIGVSALNPSRGAVEGVSIWTGIWAIISTFVAFFFGGWFAGSADERGIRRSDAIRSGVAVWGFALTIGIFLTTAGVIGAVDLARSLMVPPGVVAGVHSGYTIGAAWATFGTVLLSLGCAIAGAALGVQGPRRERRVVARTVTPGPHVPTPTPTTP